MRHKQKYINVHAHSTYSLQDAIGHPKEVLDLAKEMGFSAHSFTDHGNMLHVGDAALWQKDNTDFRVCFGNEMYFRNDLEQHTKWREEHSFKQKNKLYENIEEANAARKKIRRYDHLILLAKNKVGLQGLFELNHFAFKDGFFYKPCIDFKQLEANEKIKGNVVATSACLSGSLAHAILDKKNGIDHGEDLLEMYKRFKQIFGEDYYVEIQINELEDQAIINRELVNLDFEKVVYSNDNHYLCEAHAETQTILLNLQTKKTKKQQFTSEEKEKSGVTWEFDTKELYMKDWQDVYRCRDQYQKDISDKVLEKALENTKEIEAKIEHIEFNDSPKLWVVPEVKGKDSFAILEQRCKEALATKTVIDASREEYEKRLEFELKIVKDKKFSDYFLAVQKFVQIAEENDIAVGPGRGSAAGSLINYLLGITKLDPIRYGLFFERFLDYERDDFPDIDVDFSDVEKIKHLICDYVGEDNFAYISTYGTFQLLSLFRDVARIFDIPLELVSAMSKELKNEEIEYRRFHNIPPVEKVEKEALLKIFRKVAKEFRFDKQYEDVSGHLEVLLNQFRQVGRHAGGIVVCNNIFKKMPIIYQKGEMQTSYVESGTHKILSKFGFIKYDILGSETLRYQGYISRLLGRSIADEVDPDKIDLKDPKIYEVYKKGYTLGVFQFASNDITDFTKRVQPDSFEEVCDISAAYRPGPMGINVPGDYVSNKRSPHSITYLHEKLKKILGYSKGLPIYQEQVMQITNELGGLSLSEGNIIRKAISKEQKSERVLQFKERCMKNFKANGMSNEDAEALWKMLAKYSGYGFNKSHAYCYGMISVQTAYMKAHYPAEFYAAYLSSENIEKYSAAANEMRHFGFKIVIPKLNQADIDFTAHGTDLMVGLHNIKGIGSKQANAIVKVYQDEKCESMADFFTSDKLEHRLVNKNVTKVLINIGFFDDFCDNRRDLLAFFENYWSRFRRGLNVAFSKASKKYVDKYSDMKKVFNDSWRKRHKLLKEKYPEYYARTKVEKITANFRKEHGKNWRERFNLAYDKQELIERFKAEAPELNLDNYTDLERYKIDMKRLGYSPINYWDIVGASASIERSNAKAKENRKIHYDFDTAPNSGVIAFHVLQARKAKDKKENQMMFLEIADFYGNRESLPIFSSQYKKIEKLPVVGSIYKALLARNDKRGYSGFVFDVDRYEVPKIVKISKV